MNAFSQVTLSHNCELHDTHFFSPSRMFDIQFINDGGQITVGNDCNISSFIYKDTVNVHDEKTNKIFKKEHLKKVADTYYSFEQLLANNNVRDTQGYYYYQRKKAETRSKKFPLSLVGYLSEFIFGYGEHPFRAFFWLIILTLMYAPIYMITGFSTGEELINYNLQISQLFSWDAYKFYDLLKSIYYSFFTLITVGQGSFYPTTSLSKLIVSSELFLGVILMTTFTATFFRRITK